MPLSSGGIQTAWISVGVCIDILFIAETSEEDTPIPAKVGGREGACGGATAFVVVAPCRFLNENREGMASSSSAFWMEVSDAES